MSEKDLNALFLDTLKDIYYAEKQIYKSLPKMAKAAQSDHSAWQQAQMVQMLESILPSKE